MAGIWTSKRGFPFFLFFLFFYLFEGERERTHKSSSSSLFTFFHSFFSMIFPGGIESSDLVADSKDREKSSCREYPPARRFTFSSGFIWLKILKGARNQTCGKCKERKKPHGSEYSASDCGSMVQSRTPSKGLNSVSSRLSTSMASGSWAISAFFKTSK